MTRRTYEADAEHIETADDLMISCMINVRGGELTPVKLGVGRDVIRSALQMNFYGWIIQMKNRHIILVGIKNASR